MEPAKLQFSAHEMNLVRDAEWILTKNEILNKVSILLGAVNAAQKNILLELPQPLPEPIMATTPKLSRGENYKGLPYLVLDYPRLFTKNNIFAIRSLFWWGRTLSTTLHISGQWQQFFSDRIFQRFDLMKEAGFVISTGDNEWVHDVNSQDYTPAGHITPESLRDMLSSGHFFKMALSSSVADLNNGVECWQLQFEKVLTILA